MNFNKEEISNLLVFLNRVQLSGQEAETLVLLKIKLNRALESPTGEDKEPKKPEKKKVAKD